MKKLSAKKHIDPRADARAKAKETDHKSPDKELGHRLYIAALKSGAWRKIGLVADTHMASRCCRMVELNAAYDLFSDEGITDVFHAGNPVDGYAFKINHAEVTDPTIDGQTAIFVNEYPRRKGITTHYITGDDHEGWWIKEGFNWGRHAEAEAHAIGRTDLHYIGHVEADITFKAPHGKAVMKLQHPGGGSSYARSYHQQKMIESLEGGEKPAILAQGHHHIANLMPERNVWCIQLPGFQDQTIFGRKKRLRFEVGFAIVEFMQNEDGTIQRLKCEFVRYYTRGFYRKYLKSDAAVPRVEM